MGRDVRSAHSRTGIAASGGEVRALTGLRGIAACYVVLYHMLQDVPGDSLVATFIRHGYLAVDHFFVLSGYVMAMVHGRDTFDLAGYGLFLRKRFARIYPLYAAVTVATLLLVDVWGSAPITPPRLLVNILLLQGWGAGATIVAPAWSLSAEVGAYLVFPLLVSVLLAGRRASASTGAFLAVLLLVAISIGDPQPRSGPLDLYQPHIVAPLLRAVAGFTLGLAAFRLGRSRPIADWLSRPWSAATLGCAILVLLIRPATDLAIVVLFVPFIAALAASRTGVASRILAAPLPHRLGVLSFSIYLVHFPIRETLRPWLADRLAGLGVSYLYQMATVGACAATLVVAALTYRLIERPGRSMLLAQPRRPQTVS